MGQITVKAGYRMLHSRTGRIMRLLAIAIVLAKLLPAVTGCGEDVRLREYAGTYTQERTIDTERMKRSLKLKPGGDYNFQRKSITRGEVIEKKSGEWFVRRDRITGGDAIGLYPSPAEIRHLEITETGDLLETVSDSIYKKQEE